MSHRLDFNDVYNIRDLGGLPVAGGGVTRSGVFIRAGNLDSVSPISQQHLIDFGVKTVIDLRDEWEAKDYPSVFAQSDTVKYMNLPLIGNELSGHEVWKAETENYTQLYELYCKYLDRCQIQIGTIVAALSESTPGTIFQCYAGKDRTGIIAGLLLKAVGVSDELIAKDYSQSHSQITHLIEGWRAYAVQHGRDMQRLERDVASDAETMFAMLDEIKSQYGDVDGYLRICGVTEAQLSRLREVFIQPES